MNATQITRPKRSAKSRNKKAKNASPPTLENRY